MKPLLSLAAVLAVLVAAIAAVTASGNAGSTRHATTIHFDYKLTSVKIVDADPKDASPGDFAVLAGDLLVPGSTKKIGHYQGVCFTITSAANTECTATFALPNGQISTTTAYGKDFNGENIVHEAIIGGTRAYRNARGQSTGKETSDSTGTETLHFTR